MHYDNYDLKWTLEGDLEIEGGQVKTTLGEPLASIAQDIQSATQYLQGSWRSDLTRGREFSAGGERNSEQVGNAVRDSLYHAIIQSTPVDLDDLEIIVAPLDEETLLNIITLETEPTEENGFTGSIQLTTFFLEKEGGFYYI